MRYRPKDCLDIDIEIEKTRYKGSKYIIANIAYINRNWQNGEYLVHREKNVKISVEVMKRWVKIG